MTQDQKSVLAALQQLRSNENRRPLMARVSGCYLRTPA